MNDLSSQKFYSMMKVNEQQSIEKKTVKKLHKLVSYANLFSLLTEKHVTFPNSMVSYLEFFFLLK